MSTKNNETLSSARAGLLDALANRAQIQKAKEDNPLRYVTCAERARQVADAIRVSLKEMDCPFFERQKETTTYFCGRLLIGGCIVDTYTWILSANEDEVEARLDFPLHVSEDYRPVMAEFITHVNWKLKEGQLVMDVAGNGELALVRKMSPLEVKSNPTRAVGRLMGGMSRIFKETATGVFLIAQGTSLTEATAAYQESVEKSCCLPMKELRAASGSIEAPDLSVRLSKDYSLDGLNVEGSVSLEKIVNAVKRFQVASATMESNLRLNLLLSGPSGCGKTEFVKYLGQTTGLPVVSLLVSDIVHSHIGDTEKAIAKAFREAKETRSILFLDEVDSLLSSRAGAHYQWERTQVNELLQQMENFGGILVCATNFKNLLDTAVSRRFTFKVKMDYLTDSGKEAFFARIFKTALSLEEKELLHAIDRLTPGDFRTVHESLFLLSDGEPTNAERLCALQAESAAKTRGAAPMGF